jgi:hypothetical protein
MNHTHRFLGLGRIGLWLSWASTVASCGTHFESAKPGAATACAAGASCSATSTGLASSDPTFSPPPAVASASHGKPGALGTAQPPSSQSSTVPSPTAQSSTQPSASGSAAATNAEPGSSASASPGPSASSSTEPTGLGCAVTAERVRVTELLVDAAVTSNEDEAALRMLTISPLPNGGSRVAWMGDDAKAHVVSLDAADQVIGASVSFPAHDLGDLYADEAGGVLLLTRDAEGGGVLNCGEPSNLCGTPPDPAVPCYDTYLMRFDGSQETWATRLTDSDADLPPYSTGKEGPDVVFTWWYAHHGRIAVDDSNYAAYFGTALSIAQEGCINIHQGDRLSLVGLDGKLSAGGFGWGCSHSGFERVIHDPALGKFVTACKTDNSNRLAFAPNYRTILPVDLAYSDFGDLVLADGGGYWLIASNIREGEPAGADGFSDIHLLHATEGAADQDIVLAEEVGKNHRAPHLARYGKGLMLAAWETSSAKGPLKANDAQRQLVVQTLSAATGAAVGDSIATGVKGNRYYVLRSFPDGSVAYVAPGKDSTSLRILRILPCE